MVEFFSNPLIAMVILFGALIFFHEFGHYIVGRMCGIGVEIFSIGFGPAIFSYTRSGTKYQIALIPLGGFVKFKGAMANEECSPEIKGESLLTAPQWARALTLAAGPFANFFLAFVVFTGLGLYGIKQRAPIVGSVRMDSPAAKAGVLPGDEVLEVSGKKVKSWQDMFEIISASPDSQILMHIKRGENNLTLPIVPSSVASEDMFGKEKPAGRIGVGYGFLPPVITVLDPHSIAALAGFLTGDSVESVSYVFEGQEVVKKINSWRDFEVAIKSAAASSTCTLDILRTGKDAKKISLVFPPEFLKKEENLSTQLGFHDSQLTVAQVQEPLKKVLFIGDQVLAFNGKKLKDVFELYENLEHNKNPEIDLTLQRNFALMTVKIPLESVDIQKPAGRETFYTLRAGFFSPSVFPDPYIEKYSGIDALRYGFETTKVQSLNILETLIGLFTGKVPIKALGGPILIAKVAGDSMEHGFDIFLTSLALISINLALVNLFPIPALDGGQLVLVFVETLLRRRLSEKTIENFQKVGFVFLFSLVLLSTYNDLSRFWVSILKGASKVFE